MVIQSGDDDDDDDNDVLILKLKYYWVQKVSEEHSVKGQSVIILFCHVYWHVQCFSSSLSPVILCHNPPFHLATFSLQSLKFLPNVGIHLPCYTVSHPKRPP